MPPLGYAIRTVAAPHRLWRAINPGELAGLGIPAGFEAVSIDVLPADPVWDETSGAFVARPAPTAPGKLDIENQQLGALWARWWRWKTSTDEATARSVAAVVLTALTTQTNQAWADYVAAIQTWRTAP